MARRRQRRIRFLTGARIVEIHNIVLATYGGDDGGGHRGATNEGAEAAAQAVRNAYYTTRRQLAAAYAVYIVQGHVFLDGNKRTGAATMLLFLAVNGVRPRRWNARSVRGNQAILLTLQNRARAGASAGALVAWLATKL